ncbi:hypothetical protein EBME_1332 [bacterium endosymbiont of Mortierella elongata FMR23-6]|nr:hypothetical protein EBME_1332 [bacterium endosymbiont of Mortierella elongata FMR23-6]
MNKKWQKKSAVEAAVKSLAFTLQAPAQGGEAGSLCIKV